MEETKRKHQKRWSVLRSKTKKANTGERNRYQKLCLLAFFPSFLFLVFFFFFLLAVCWGAEVLLLGSSAWAVLAVSYFQSQRFQSSRMFPSDYAKNEEECPARTQGSRLR
ncbi:hypothetical protein BDP55DRAFT_336461 [Colletotrichum godetiae]|uniref:Transmembrane protein n=1 Tax=Colletotrichum godetiae TaxID=1209918 RepID=A0AAJ0AAP4_9PEZI|nr:uncharacterized protein BDP55DRAFT_336461 [Colletotrichum godetiae]KAK1659653.1 hypothetical protein BDP55DRAFT_336461 [Colletotrichum godetiae]